MLLQVADEYLLAATREAREFCPYVTQINASAAAYWRIFEETGSMTEILTRASEVFDKPKEDILLPALAFIKKMSKSGYLLVEENP